MDVDGPLTEINVTNLVDVMLVLLVLFMITAPILKGGLDVELPETRAARPLDSDGGVTVSVLADGSLRVDDQSVDEAQLVDLVGAREGAPIYLVGDRGVDYGRVIAVLGLLHEAGIEGVGLVADPVGSAR